MLTGLSCIYGRSRNMLRKIINMVKAQLYDRGGKLDYNTWIFSSVDNNNFNYNSKYLFLYVREQLPEIKACYVIDDEKKRRILAKKYGNQYFISSQTGEGLRMILDSGVWITSAGIPAYTLKNNSERIVVNLWHGIPLKKIALMEEQAGRLQKMYFRKLFSEKYTYILTTSSHLVSVMAKSFAVPSDKVKVWGQPRNDAILQSRSRDAFLQRIGVDQKKCRKLILYAPTFRDGKETWMFPFADYDGEKMEKFLEEKGWYMCLRTHLSEHLDVSRFSGAHIRFANEDVADDIAQWMGCFDLLITDYSSIYLDYLLLEKPIVFLPYDKEEYLKNRGMNFPYDKVTPGPKPENQKAFLRNMEMLLEGEDTFREKRRKCNDYFNQVKEPCCGRICQEILHTVKCR